MQLGTVLLGIGSLGFLSGWHETIQCKILHERSKKGVVHAVYAGIIRCVCKEETLVCARLS